MAVGLSGKVKEIVQQVPEEVFGIKNGRLLLSEIGMLLLLLKNLLLKYQRKWIIKLEGYIQIEIPQCEVKYNEIDISAHPDEHPGEHDKFKLEWDKFNLWSLVMKVLETVERAYSMASFPAEGREIMLNVRIATPLWIVIKTAGWM